MSGSAPVVIVPNETRSASDRRAGSCDAGRDLGVLGPLVTLRGEARRWDDQHGPVGVMKDAVRHAAEHQRLHAAAPACAESAACASADPS